jgi:asparagine synthase (glutamine-hydrolysing)
MLKSFFEESTKPSWIYEEYLSRNGVFLQQSMPVQIDENRGRRVVEALANSIQLGGLPQLLRHSDRNSMRFSVESRVPFLTLQTADLLLSLPEHYLISNQGETKYVFREAMRGIVPDQILNRSDKIGFETPEKLWLSTMAPTVRKWLKDADEIDFLNSKALLDEFDAIMTGRLPFTWQVWRWINFIRWYKNIFGTNS